MYHKKIDIYFNGDYYRSTNRSKTCKDARLRLIGMLEDKKHSFTSLSLLEDRILKNKHLIKARFSK